MLTSLSVVLLAAAPEVAVLSTVPDAELTEVRFQPIGAAAPVPAAARLQHVAFEDVFGALVPGTRTVVATTLARPARDLSFASSLWALEAGKPARLLCDRVAFANRPVVSAEGRIFVQRGKAETVTVDEVDLRSGKTRELLAFSGSAAFIAGTLGREVLVYRISATGADLVAVHADALGVRVLIPAMPALARDFAVTADRSALVYTQSDGARWFVERLELRTLARTRLAEGPTMALLPTPWPDGRLAFAPAEGAGLTDLEGKPLLAPAGKGFERVRAFLKDRTPIGVHETPGGFPAPIGFAAPPRVRLDVAGVLE